MTTTNEEATDAYSSEHMNVSAYRGTHKHLDNMAVPLRQAAFNTAPSTQTGARMRLAKDKTISRRTPECC